jgi:hypothetical protein
MRRPFLHSLVLLGTVLGARAGSAAPQLFPPDRNANAGANIFKPVTLQKQQDLDFGAVAVTTAGTAVLNPSSETVSTTGGVVFAGGLPHAALFQGISPSGNIVVIRLPNSAATLTRVGGTETMTVDTWTMDGAGRRTVVSRQPFTFKVGGTLHVAANQTEGTYTGTFNVDIQFP